MTRTCPTTPDNSTSTPLREDEALIARLARDMPVLTGDDAEYRLAVLLSGWRRDTPSSRCRRFRVSMRSSTRSQHPSRPGAGAVRCGTYVVVSGAAAVAVVAAAGLIVVAEGAPARMTPRGSQVGGLRRAGPADQARWCRPRTTWSKPSRPFRQATCHRPTA